MAETTIPLTKPVRAHGEDLHVLILAEPTTADMIEVGYPFTIHADGSVRPEAKAIARMIARLAKVPPSTVNAMAPRDFQAAMGALMGFFTPPEDSPPIPPDASRSTETPGASTGS